MQVIFVDRRLARARTIDLTPRMMIGGMVALTTAVLLAVIGLYVVTFRAAAELRLPVVHDLVTYVMRDEVARNDQFVRDNISTLARRLGEMQAQLMRLDALGIRVSKLAGIRPEEFSFNEMPGRGGALPGDSRGMTLDEVKSEIDRIGNSVAHRRDYLDVIESELMSAQVRRTLLPENTPVSEGFIGSGYGMRTDPFTGQIAMHAGVDFAAPIGTPIFAAAGGVVTNAEPHPIYGNQVRVDHGNDLSTVYAHASKLLVKVGDIVRRGQKIAEVGTTGRSTGPHLHFEVHNKGVPQNPAKFLAAQKRNSPLAAVAGGNTAQIAPQVDLRGLSAAANSAAQ